MCQTRLFLVLNLQYEYLRQYLSYYFHTWHDGRHLDATHADDRFDDLDLDARSHWVGKGKKKLALNALDN